MNRPTKNFRQAIATILMLTVGSFSNLLLTSTTAQVTAMKFKGELAAIRGAVTLNGFTVKTGAVLFSESRIETGENASATIDLGQQGQLVLGSNSVFVLQADAANVSGNLRNGSITTHVTSGVNVITADATASTNGAMTVDVNCGSTRVAASTSDVKVTGAGKTEVVTAGNETTVGVPQNNSRCPRMATYGGAGAVGGTISGGLLATLLIVGLGGAVAGIVVATQDNAVSGVVVSPIR